jgi:hypothetical protein
MGACFSNFCLLCLPGIWLRGPGVSLPWACQPSPQTGGLPAWKGEGSCPGRPMPCHWATGSRRQTRGLPSPLAHEPRALRAQGRGSLGPSRGSALAEPRARLCLPLRRPFKAGPPVWGEGFGKPRLLPFEDKQVDTRS